MVLIRSCIYFVYLSLSVVFFSIPAILFGRFLSFITLSKIANAWGTSNLLMLKVICGLDYRISGLENLPSEPCIVMSKHQSAWETIALRSILPPSQAWILKKELMAVPFFGWALKALDPIAIDRGAGRKAVKQILRQGKKALSQGKWVVVFPEGTRTAPGQRKKYGVGGAILAASSGHPVVPIAHNAGLFWKRRGVRKFPGTIQICIGKAILSDGKSADEIIQEVEDWIENKVEALPKHIEEVKTNGNA